MVHFNVQIDSVFGGELETDIGLTDIFWKTGKFAVKPQKPVKFQSGQ